MLDILTIVDYLYVTFGENGQIFFINKRIDPYYNCCVKTKLKTLMIPGP